MDVNLLLAVEEARKKCVQKWETECCFPETASKVDPHIAKLVSQRIQKGKEEVTLYDKILEHIRHLKNPLFFKKNGEVKESAFYKYAYIDKSTWSELRWNLIVPKKKTLLKLVIALRLNEEEAIDLMRRGSNGFDPRDIRDQIILALIDIQCYEPDTVYEVLEEYRQNGPQKFENIYD